jgi:hypothetical protein
MTTTLIYEPIAHISDDYFQPPKADGSVSSRDNTNDQGVIETRRLALNITDGTAIGWLQRYPKRTAKSGITSATRVGDHRVDHEARYYGQVQGIARGPS